MIISSALGSGLGACPVPIAPYEAQRVGIVVVDGT